MEWLAILGLFTAGVLIATAAMAIGIGGGILWTPLLIVGYGLSPSEAVTLSLLIQVIGLGSGSWVYLRSGLSNHRLSLLLFAVAAPGVMIGSLFSLHLAQSHVQLALGIMAMTLALLFVAVGEGDEGRSRTANTRRRLWGILPVPAFFGGMMGLLSTGIGEWIIPLLKSRLGIEMRRAIATVIPVMFLLALTAASLRTFYIADPIAWEYVLWGGLGTLIGGQIGPQLNKRMAERLLKEAFIYLMTLVGIHLIFQAV